MKEERKKKKGGRKFGKRDTVAERHLRPLGIALPLSLFLLSSLWQQKS